MKVATIVGTRPEIIRLSRVMAALDRNARARDDPHRPELRLRTEPDLLRGPGAAQAGPFPGSGRRDGRRDDRAGHRPRRCGAAPGAAGRRPDSRRHEQLPGRDRRQARKIPVFHMEAGNRCFDQRVPGGDQPPDRRPHQRHQPALSRISREYLLREGLPPDRVIKTGSPMYEVLHHYLPKIEASRRARPAGPAARASISWSAPIARRTSTIPGSSPS